MSSTSKKVFAITRSKCLRSCVVVSTVVVIVIKCLRDKIRVFNKRRKVVVVVVKTIIFNIKF
jgi:hypothetical protein